MGGKLIKQNLLLRWTIQLREMNPKFIGKVFNGQSKETQSTKKAEKSLFRKVRRGELI